MAIKKSTLLRYRQQESQPLERLETSLTKFWKQSDRTLTIEERLKQFDGVIQDIAHKLYPKNHHSGIHHELRKNFKIELRIHAEVLALKLEQENNTQL